MKELLSPKQVATSIGVSESSLKRWCDQGVLSTERTPGGHRRIRIDEVLRFLRDQDQPLVRPEVLGLPVGTGQGPRSIAKSTDALLDALKAGDGEQSRRLVLDLYLGGTSIVKLCDELVAPVLQEVGEGWACGSIEIYQEHRACEVLNRILYDLRSILAPPSPSAPVAIGGTPPGDNYRLATLMVELVLVDVGWNAMSLGSSLPFATMAAAAQHHQPELFWLSLSHVADADVVKDGFAELLKTTPESMRVVIGGQQAAGLLDDLIDGERVHYGADLVSLRKIVGEMRP
ncbi:MAG: B12-binding domain-containing protein [Planctomycetota bacterium]